MNYISKVNKQYNFCLIIIESIIFGGLLYLVEKYDLFMAKLINLYTNKFSMFVTVIILLSLIVLLSLCFLYKGINDKKVNYTDKLLIISSLALLIYIVMVVRFNYSYKMISYIILIHNLVVMLYRSRKLKKSK